VFHTGALWDAAAPTYWEVSDGTRTAVVEGWRVQAGGPLRYRLRSGRVVAERLPIEVPEDEIRREVDRALYPGVAPERKLRAFVDAFKEIAWSTDPAAFVPCFDVPGDPTLAVAKLPAAALAALESQIRRIFDPAESAKLIAGLSAIEADWDAFTVLVRQRVRVEG
jgi:hypothetical protein